MPDSTSTERQRRSRRRARSGLVALLAAALVTACTPSGPKFHAVDITGAPYAKELRLADGEGRTRTLADFQGKVVGLFFGYTHCPDVCPTTLAKMAAVRKRLGPDADRVQMLFVTVDPERDTADVLRTYVPAFDPSFIGLRGDPAATAEMAKEFKIFYQKSGPSGGDGYTVDHTAFTYLYDPAGRIRLLVKHDATPEAIADDIRQLLKGG